MSNATHRKLHYRVYAVQRRKSPRASWTDIGAATTHQDGKGFDLDLQSMPLMAEELVVRTAAERILPNGVTARQTDRKGRRFASRPAAKDTASIQACM